MMMQEKLLVNDRQATLFMTKYFSTHVENVDFENFAAVLLFSPENLF